MSFDDDDVHFEADQVGRERRQPLISFTRPPVFDDEVSPLEVPELLQCLTKSVEAGWKYRCRTDAEIPDPIDRAPALRVDDDRHAEETESENDST